MSRAIVHIGAGKTGSTALQYYLTHNATTLRGLGIAYPIVRKATTRMDGANLNRLAYLFLEPGPAAAERAMAKALALSAAECPVTLLSAEVLYMRPFESEFDSAESYMAAKRAALDRFFALMAPFDQVDVLCYVRRHDRWLESIYNERMKTGRTGSSTFDQFAARYGRSHYRPQLDAWAERLTNGRVTVRPYEAALRGEGGLIGDFRRAVGIREVLPEPPRTLRSANPSLGRDFIEFSRRARELALTRRESARLATGLMEISARQLAVDPEPKSWSLFLSFDERVALLRSFAEEDEAVARKYLSADFERLFDPPSPSENADYPGLSVDRAFEIAGELLGYNRAIGSPIMRRVRRYAKRLLPPNR